MLRVIKSTKKRRLHTPTPSSGIGIREIGVVPCSNPALPPHWPPVKMRFVLMCGAAPLHFPSERATSSYARSVRVLVLLDAGSRSWRQCAHAVPSNFEKGSLVRVRAGSHDGIQAIRALSRDFTVAESRLGQEDIVLLIAATLDTILTHHDAVADVVPRRVRRVIHCNRTD